VDNGADVELVQPIVRACAIYILTTFRSSVWALDSRVRIRSYCVLYLRCGQGLLGEMCPLSCDISFPLPCQCGHPLAMLAPCVGCPPGPVVSCGLARRVGPTTVPREIDETMHPCHGIHGCPWHGVGGKIQISKFWGGWQTVLHNESLVSSVSRSVPTTSSILLFEGRV
jgi:hypothetical protein